MIGLRCMETVHALQKYKLRKKKATLILFGDKAAKPLNHYFKLWLSLLALRQGFQKNCPNICPEPLPRQMSSGRMCRRSDWRKAGQVRELALKSALKTFENSFPNFLCLFKFHSFSKLFTRKLAINNKNHSRSLLLF